MFGDGGKGQRPLVSSPLGRIRGTMLVSTRCPGPSTRTTGLLPCSPRGCASHTIAAPVSWGLGHRAGPFTRGALVSGGECQELHAHSPSHECQELHVHNQALCTSARSCTRRAQPLARMAGAAHAQSSPLHMCQDLHPHKPSALHEWQELHNHSPALCSGARSCTHAVRPLKSWHSSEFWEAPGRGGGPFLFQEPGAAPASCSRQLRSRSWEFPCSQPGQRECPQRWCIERQPARAPAPRHSPWPRGPAPGGLVRGFAQIQGRGWGPLCEDLHSLQGQGLRALVRGLALIPRAGIEAPCERSCTDPEVDRAFRARLFTDPQAKSRAPHTSLRLPPLCTCV